MGDYILAREKHPNKHVEEAIKYAESKGWTTRKGTGHCCLRLLCPYGEANPDCRCGLYCSSSIWKTPRKPEDMAKKIISRVDKCKYPDGKKGKG